MQNHFPYRPQIIKQKQSILSPQQQYQSHKKNNQKYSKNQTLQQLLQTQTILSYHLQTQKKRLFPELSFYSKDHTNDQSNQQGYEQFIKKIHFEISKNKQLNKTITQLKNELIQKYMKDLMQEFNTLSEENKMYREQFRKEGGGKRNKPNNNNNLTNNMNLLNTKFLNEEKIQTPRNIKARKSFTGGSMIVERMPQYNNMNNIKESFFKSSAFVQHKKPDMKRQLNKQFFCESSTNIHANQSMKQSPIKHKRRESQLTQRKDYPNDNDYQIFDDQSQIAFEQESQRMSIPGKTMKRLNFHEREIVQPKNFNHWANQQKVYNEYCNKFLGLMNNKNEVEYFYQPTNTKNIFVEFLEQILIEEKISSKQITSQIDEDVKNLNNEKNQPSYYNLKHIQTLEQQIMQKNLKLKQLQQVINIFKEQIQQITGTDIKQVNQLMLNLLEVKGKFIEMQEKVNGLTQLKNKYQMKEQMKIQIIKKIAEKAQAQNKKQQNKQNKGQANSIFSLPQSIKALFEILDIKMKKNARPLDYLLQVKQLGNNRQVFHAFHSNKRSQAHGKIREIIDSIKQGRRKFNEFIKLYQGRIVKLQEKIQKYKSHLQNQNSQQKQESNHKLKG